MHVVWEAAATNRKEAKQNRPPAAGRLVVRGLPPKNGEHVGAVSVEREASTTAIA
jgi:hypothetical protein